MLLAQNVAEWLTSFWFLTLGSLFGILLFVVLFASMWGASIAGFGRLVESKKFFWVGGFVLSLIFVAAGVGIFYYSNHLGVPNVVFDKPMLDKIQKNLFISLILGVPVCFILGYGLLAAISEKSRTQYGEWMGEGVGFWLLMITGSLSFLGVVGIGCQYLPSMRFGPAPTEIAHSLLRWKDTGPRPYQTYMLADHDDQHQGDRVEVNFKASELKFFRIETTSRLYLSFDPYTKDAKNDSAIEIEPTKPGKPRTFSGGAKSPKEEVDVFYIKNVGGEEATFKIQVVTEPKFPEVELIVYTGIFVLALFVAFLCQCALLPKESAISWATFKTETSQPIFAVLLGIGIVFLVVAVYIPYNTFGEDIKMYATTGLPVILLMSVFFAIWSASKSVSEEIEGRTALTVLAKPIGRRQFIVGKVLGIAWAVGMLYLLLGLWFMFLNSYKPVYDGVESSLGRVEWQQCYVYMVKLVPALALHYMETVIFIFLAAMISTRMAIRSNLMICMSIYVLGHITPLLLQQKENFEGVTVVGQTISTIIPVLSHFDVQAAIVGGDAQADAIYLSWTLLYCLLYSSVTLLVALILFEDRDLA